MNADKRQLPIEMQIAVIGMAGRFPGAQNIREFWSALSRGLEAITFFSRNNLPAWSMQPELVNEPNFVPARGVLPEAEYFDADFFGYSRREAQIMDPQMRVFHECVWEALEDAGYNPEGKNGSVGIFAGASPNVYWQGMALLRRNGSASEQFAALSFADKDFMNAQVSYKLNFNGPCVTVDSACSTSLVAIHLACRALLTGECGIALAGGVSVPVPNPPGYLYQEGMILSPDGHCRAFDGQAQGTVPGEGAGVVVLKPLKRALADGDHIYAVIRGSAINNDGHRKIGFTAPSIEGQAEVIRAAHRMSMVEAESISYVEAHGTGTVLGDPIEIEALSAAFATQQRGYCALGSVKSNIGHLDAAAGVAGVIKTVLALAHRQIPASLHYTQANPRIDFAHSPFVVAEQLQEWRSPDGQPRRAGVSSFGIGGTNAHVILQQAPEQPPRQEQRGPHLLVLSARSQGALEQVRERLRTHLQEHPALDLGDVAHTLQVGRRAFAHRQALVCHSVPEALVRLGEAQTSREVGQHPPAVYWLFPGQGSQYVNMARGLYEHEPVFRQEVERGLQLAQEAGAGGVRALLYPEAGCLLDEEGLRETEQAQVALFVVEYALGRLLLHRGGRPAGMLGHSIGEYVAACLAGVFTLEEGVRLVVQRGRLMGQAPRGGMLSVALGAEEVQPYLSAGVSIAAYNAPQVCVLAGSLAEIEEVEQRLRRQGKRVQRVATSHAFHSPLMEPVLPAYAQVVRQFDLQAPRVPYLSNVTGDWIGAQEARTVEYWVRHLREPVRFAQGIERIVQQQAAVVLEVGPGRSLGMLVRQGVGRGREVIQVLRHGREEREDEEVWQEALGRVWMAGVPLDWAVGVRQQRRLSLPTYPFQRQRFSFEDMTEKDLVAKSGLLSTPMPALQKPGHYFYTPTWERQDFSLDSLPSSTKTYLVFHDEQGFVVSLAKRLRNNGDNVVLVSKGSTYKEWGDGLFAIDPTQEKHYQRLFISLHSKYKAIDTIVYCWGMARTSASSKDLAQITDDVAKHAYHGLLVLARVTAKHQEAPIHLAIITDALFEVAGTESIDPTQALLLGPGKVIPLEYQNITCTNIDISLTESSTDERLLDALFKEVTTALAGDVVALRGRSRWKQVLKQCYPSAGKALQIKQRGTYLITGGTGAIGLTLAKALAEAGQVNLVLVARSSFPKRDTWENWLKTHPEDEVVSRKIQQLSAIEKLGSTVMVVNADVACREDMQRVVGEVIHRFQVLDGVIHCAGIADGALIERRTKEWDQHILSAKVQGTLILDEVLSELHLDFVVLCSALSALTGSIGQVGYTAANSFLDAFAYYKSAQGIHGWQSVAWDTWRDAGMAAEANAMLQASVSLPEYRELLHQQFSRGLSSEEGASIFLQVLTMPAPSIAISIEELVQRMDRSRSQHLLSTHKGHMAEVDKPQRTLETASDLELLIADAWKSFLDLETIDMRDNWFDLGASSLDIIQVVNILNANLGVSVSTSQMFTYPTVRSLAEFLYQKDLRHESEADDPPSESVSSQDEREEQLNSGKARLKSRLTKIKRDRGNDQSNEVGSAPDSVK